MSLTTKVMDIKDQTDREIVEAGYYVLFSPDLQCIPQQNNPNFNSEKVQDNYLFIACYDYNRLVGLCAVFNDYVYYPVMAGDYRQILRALILRAYKENGNYLRAYTDNELILSTAVDMGIGVTRDGKTLEFK